MTGTRITDFEAVAPMPIYTQADLDAAVQKERTRCAAPMRVAMGRVSLAASFIDPSVSEIDGLTRKAFDTAVGILQSVLNEVEEVSGKEPA